MLHAGEFGLDAGHVDPMNMRRATDPEDRCPVDGEYELWRDNDGKLMLLHGSIVPLHQEHGLLRGCELVRCFQAGSYEEARRCLYDAE